jgi:predicted nucleic acid-binding protein
MSASHPKYCLDANVLIQAWQKYYSPKLCPDSWTVLDQLGKEDRIFLPQMVYEEITKTDDDLATWLKESNIPEYKIDGPVTEALKNIYAANSAHQNLVDNTKGRSLADPWVIAHAIKEKATIVTKEEKITALNTTKIKIPNVCDNMGVRWINDYQLADEMNIRFACSIKV